MTVHKDDSARSAQLAAEDVDVDVLVVGYGPVGQLLAVLLAEKGHKVGVIERWPSAYPLPRAVAFDGEAARILAAAGVSDCFARIGESSRDYTVTNLAGDVLLRHDAEDTYRNGWPDSTSMYQPGLEAALTERGASLPGLRLFRDHEAVLLEEDGDRVTVEAIEGATGRRRRFTSGWVLGCDGANSFVRASVNPQFTDYGLHHEWLVCDVVLHEDRTFEHNNLQLADPGRPRVAVSAGPGHRRWEFMRMPQDDPETFNSEEKAWELLRLFDVHPGNATLDRFTSYTFRARLADRWRSGRLLIAGDAAHLMPPFAGQGMCSGLRDAANLAWKLDLVLRGVAGDGLLDTYTPERRSHVQKSIIMSVNLGKVICMTDAKAAADRDTVMLASRKRGIGAQRPQTVLERLKDGVVLRDADERPVGLAGHLAPQGRVAGARGTGRFDEIVGTGFVLLTTQNPAGLTEGVLDAGHRAFLADLGVTTVRVLPAGTPLEDLGADDVVDVDQVYLSYLAEQSATVALVRPDFYLFGAVEHVSGLPALLESLRQQTAAVAVAG
ncbi:bifunctional 3-(3-hydroxy-phenyl)propionate/3-hydroxycinnamic acid hydroxylase [Streptomyces sp. NPDC051987]|uniref:bifunctional 3-(3-hydroxy-phenyl)propionate/3-hydroxycinnamic acid hydroxylase MhpA n=1 Tax=Streptomyces sp. NPDC051987 TaxID=3155808 RepID=UPI00343A04C9